MKSKTSFFERYPRLTIIVLIFIFYVVIDFVTGIFFIPKDYQAFRIRHQYYHHDILPNQCTITRWGPIRYHFCSNSLGFRDNHKRDVPIETNKKRILFLGDSHTEAVGVEFNKSFVGRLIKMVDTTHLDLLNASVVSYSPKTHYLKIKYLIEKRKLKFDELFVILDMSDLNNEIAYESFEPTNFSPLNIIGFRVNKFFKNRSSTVYACNKIIERRRNSFFYEHMAMQDDVDLELYSDFFSDFKNAELLNNPNFHHVSLWFSDERFKKWAYKSIELAQENMLKLIELCDNHNIKITISVHPWQEQIIQGISETEYVKLWKTFCEDNKVRFINFFELFINGENPKIVTEKYYITNDNHWNEHGHKLVADELIKYINY